VVTSLIGAGNAGGKKIITFLIHLVSPSYVLGLRASQTLMSPPLDVYYKYVVNYDKLGFKTSVATIIYKNNLVGTVERKPTGNNPLLFCTEIFVKGRQEDIEKFQRSLVRHHPEVKNLFTCSATDDFPVDNFIALIIPSGESL
jgi:hypothetical protein